MVIMTSKISRAEKAVLQSRVKELLEAHHPEVVSTIFVEFDTGQSDIDVVCEYLEQKTFTTELENNFQNYESYDIKVYPEYVIARFKVSGFLFEVYGAPISTRQQLAYRHYQVIQRLALLGGEPIKRKIRVLKRSGLKTEPAISKVLRLEGDPFKAVLELELWSNEQLESHIKKCI